MSLNIELARANMIQQQVRPWSVLDERVLEALRSVRRENFVPEAMRDLAFADLELPIGHGEVMMKPVLEGRVLQAVLPMKFETVVEIGTGTGFLTACLMRLAQHVRSIERHADFVDAAHRRLVASGFVNSNFTLAHAEATNGFQLARPVDVLVATGAVAYLPPRWREWVKPGGRLFAIVGESPAQHAMLYTRAEDGSWSEQSLFETDLPYLVHAAPVARFAL
jgi:protein-L-isoaspartate(D-aspartate) O-methyltransferase